LLFHAIVSREFVLRILGWWNRRLHFLKLVYVAYPGDRGRDLAFWGGVRIKKWEPHLAGFAIRDGRLVLVALIGSTEIDFERRDNRPHLAELVQRTERIRSLLGAEHKAFAGILPGLLFKHRIVHQAPEVDVAARAIVRAEAEVRRLEGLPTETPIIVLGGGGVVGRRVAERFAGRTIFRVDVCQGLPRAQQQWPAHLRGQSAILINVSRSRVLSQYLDRAWPGLVLLDHVYPQPSPSELEGLDRKGLTAYQVHGIDSRSFPKLPSWSRGAIGIHIALTRLRGPRRDPE